MGSLTLPPSGVVYVDAQILIYTVERHPSYGPALEPLWRAVFDGALAAVTSELSLMETLVVPLRNRNTSLVSDYQQALLGSDLRLLPITQPVLLEAARLRATLPGLRTPDALHAATAITSDCVLFLTNDSGFRRVPTLNLVVLGEALAN